jgi:hypothetical protein
MAMLTAIRVMVSGPKSRAAGSPLGPSFVRVRRMVLDRMEEIRKEIEESRVSRYAISKTKLVHGDSDIPTLLRWLSKIAALTVQLLYPGLRLR